MLTASDPISVLFELIMTMLNIAFSVVFSMVGAASTLLLAGALAIAAIAAAVLIMRSLRAGRK